MNALEIFFIAIAFNCLMFFGLCIYLTFLNKKERKVKTTKFDHSYDALKNSAKHNRKIEGSTSPFGDYIKWERSDKSTSENLNYNAFVNFRENIQDTPILFGHGFKEMTEEESKEYLTGLKELIDKSPDSIDITDEHWKLKEDTDYMKVTILDKTERKCNSKDEV